MRLSHYTASHPVNGFRCFEGAVSRLVNEPRTGQSSVEKAWSPAVDIVESEDAITLKADLPDVKIENIDIKVENNTLTLSGHRKFEKDETVKGVHRIERSFGEFTRSFRLPNTVNNEAVSADYNNGVLTIKLPKNEAAKPRQVKVVVQSEAKVN